LRNWKSYGHRVDGAGSMERLFMLADPQTSGGLLIAVDPTAKENVIELLQAHQAPITEIGHFGIRKDTVPIVVT
jgi:selenide,water dikinase